MTQIKRALISCTDKSGILDLAKCLATHGTEILSTGGTAKLLRENGIAVKEVADYTGSPEILDGRLKTLHPKIHGGILGIRENTTHQKQMKDNGIGPIDLVVVNLYEFEKTIADPKCALDHAIENIDIGGPTMLRAAAKNYKDVLVVIDPTDYAELIRRIEAKELSEDFKFRLAVKVFQKTSQYDTAISAYLTKKLEAVSISAAPTEFPQSFVPEFTKIQDLRYGENPHQKAAFYREAGATSGIVNAKQTQGKELSFNNILDLESAYACCKEFSAPACVIVKHLNPCGVAIGTQPSDAFLKAREADPVSCFGGIVAINREVDGETARHMCDTFFEAIIAPSYNNEAIDLFAKKKNLRVMTLANFGAKTASLDFRRVSGGLLVQDADIEMLDLAKCEAVTKRKPTAAEIEDLNFGWRVVKHVKSNAIVFAKNKQTLGVGAGQMSRVDSVKIAAIKAVENLKDKDILVKSIMASDAFFPFRDGVDLAIKHGITAIAQPGGSVRDQEVIDACNENNIAMIFTGMRHFRH